MPTKKQIPASKAQPMLRHRGAPKVSNAQRASNLANQAGNARNTTLDGVSDCAKNYLDALIDPFKIYDHACVPMFPCIPSRKMSTFSRGQFTSKSVTSTKPGFFYITAEVGHGVTSDLAMAYTNDLNTNSEVIGAESPVYSNSDYTSATFGSDPSNNSNAFKIVAFGMRVRFVGTEFNAGGEGLAVMEPDNMDLTGMSYSALGAYGTPTTYLSGGKWVTVCWHPTSAAMLEYYNNPAALTAPATIAIAGYTAASSQQLEYQVFAHYEVTGPKVRGKTAMMADIVGTQAVLNYIMTRNARPTSKAVAEKIVAQTVKEGSGQNTRESSTYNLAKEEAKMIGEMAGREARRELLSSARDFAYGVAQNGVATAAGLIGAVGVARRLGPHARHGGPAIGE